MGAKVLPKLKMSGRSIEHKYHEGNVKRTLKRELKVFETVSNRSDQFCWMFVSSFLLAGDRWGSSRMSFTCLLVKVGRSAVWKAG